MMRKKTSMSGGCYWSSIHCLAQILVLFLSVPSSISFIIPSSISSSTCPPSSVSRHHRHHCRRRGSSAIWNVPPPDPNSIDGADTMKDQADRESPPQNFYELQRNSVEAVKRAMADGYKLLEIEFPPLPSNVLEMDDVSTYEVSRANVQLAIDFCKPFAQMGKSLAILLPDEAEMNIAIEGQGTDVPYPNVFISSLRKSDENDQRLIKPEQLLLNLFGGGSGGTVKPMENIDIYIIVVASTQELPDVEELHTLDPNKVIITYNLKLDVLRGDLGAPAFPPKAFQDRFLSRIKPAYYLRTRQYSRSTPNPPFMINYQGCLFRSYPGQYQTLLDTGNGRYRRVEGNDIRPALGMFKEQLTGALKMDGLIEEEGKALTFLRTGYKTTTWWEEDNREDASNDWKT